MINNHNEDSKNVDIRQISMPALMLIGVITFVAWATWTGAAERYEIKEEMYREHQILRKELEVKMMKIEEYDLAQKTSVEAAIRQQTEIINRVYDLLSRVRERQIYVLENLWTKSDHENWCRQQELSHPEFKCEPYNTGRGRQVNGTVNDSGSEDLKRAVNEDPKKLWQDDEFRHPSGGARDTPPETKK